MSKTLLYSTHVSPARDDAPSTCPECRGTRVETLQHKDDERQWSVQCHDCGATITPMPLDYGPQGPRLAYPWETVILWFEDIHCLDYVRVGLWGSWEERNEPPPEYLGDERLVGYAFTAPDAPAEGFTGRRVFWLKGCDRDSDPHGPYARSAPPDAIDPRTVQPCFAGFRTARVSRE